MSVRRRQSPAPAPSLEAPAMPGSDLYRSATGFAITSNGAIGFSSELESRLNPYASDAPEAVVPVQKNISRPDGTASANLSNSMVPSNREAWKRMDITCESIVDSSKPVVNVSHNEEMHPAIPVNATWGGRCNYLAGEHVGHVDLADLLYDDAHVAGAIGDVRLAAMPGEQAANVVMRIEKPENLTEEWEETIRWAFLVKIQSTSQKAFKIYLQDKLKSLPQGQKKSFEKKMEEMKRCNPFIAYRSFYEDKVMRSRMGNDSEVNSFLKTTEKLIDFWVNLINEKSLPAQWNAKMFKYRREHQKSLAGIEKDGENEVSTLIRLYENAVKAQMKCNEDFKTHAYNYFSSVYVVAPGKKQLQRLGDDASEVLHFATLFRKQHVVTPQKFDAWHALEEFSVDDFRYAVKVHDIQSILEQIHDDNLNASEKEKTLKDKPPRRNGNQKKPVENAHDKTLHDKVAAAAAAAAAAAVLHHAANKKGGKDASAAAVVAAKNALEVMKAGSENGNANGKRRRRRRGKKGGNAEKGNVQPQKEQQQQQQRKTGAKDAPVPDGKVYKPPGKDRSRSTSREPRVRDLSRSRSRSARGNRSASASSRR